MNPINNLPNPMMATPAAMTAVQTADTAVRDREHERQSPIHLTGRADFLRNTGRPVQVKTSQPKSLSERRQKGAKGAKGKEAPKNEALEAAMHKLLEEMHADGDKEDLGDERRDPLEQLGVIKAAQEYIESLDVPSEEERKTLPDNDPRKTLTHESKKQDLDRLGKREATVRKNGGPELAKAEESGKQLQAKLNELVSSGASVEEMLQQLKPLFNGGTDKNGTVGKIPALELCKAFAKIYGSEMAKGITQMGKSIGQSMRPQLGAAQGGQKAPQVYMSLQQANEFHRLQTAQGIAQKIYNDVTSAQGRPPRSGAHHLTVVVLEIPETGQRDADELMKALGDIHAELDKVLHSLIYGVQSMPSNWWSEESRPAQGDLIANLRERLANVHNTGESREQKQAGQLEKQLRGGMQFKAKL